MKNMKKVISVILSLLLMLSVWTVTASAGVTDSGGNIIRETAYLYHTNLTFKGKMGSMIFNKSLEEIEGNPTDEAAVTAIAETKAEFESWADENGGFDPVYNEGAVKTRYTVHDEIVNGEDFSVRIITYVDKTTEYTVIAAASHSMELPLLLPAFSNEQTVTVGVARFETPHYIELGEDEEIYDVTGTVSYAAKNGNLYEKAEDFAEYLASLSVGTTEEVVYLFLGSGKYDDFTDKGSLLFTVVDGIDEVNITIDAPTSDEKLADTAAVTGKANGQEVDEECLVVENIEWYLQGEKLGDGVKAEEEAFYQAMITVRTDRGASFVGSVDDISVNVNGIAVLSDEKELTIDENTGFLTFKARFDKTEKLVSFPDVNDTDWFYDAVRFCAKNGYITGYSNGYFGPADNISRQDFVVILARIDGVNLSSYNKASSMKDVQSGAYYTAAVNWAVDNGIVTGYTGGAKAGWFGVGDSMTREQLVTMLYRYIKNYKHQSVTAGSAKAGAYSDYASVSEFAKDAIDWAIDKGVIGGMDATHIGPQGNASRAQVAKIFQNAFDKGILYKEATIC